VTDAANREASAGQARDIAVAIERTAANGMGTTERNASLLLSAVDKNAGEARLTTVVTDAASREASAMQARDLAMAIERNGSTAVNSVERNGGDTRTSVVQQAGETRSALYNTRKDIIDQTNLGTTNILGSLANTANIINSTAWETRSKLTDGFASNILEQNRSKDWLSAQASNNFSSIQLEQQKVKELLSSQSSQEFAMLQLEQQKAKELLSSQSYQQFGILQLEQQKAKENLTLQIQDSKFEALKHQQFLSAQMAQSTNQISTQQAAATADAKYEALKNQQLLSAQLAECCCDIKSRVDQRSMDITNVVNTLDTNRLRDNWVTARDEVNIYRVFDRFDRDHRGRSRSPRRDFRGGEDGRR